MSFLHILSIHPRVFLAHRERRVSQDSLQGKHIPAVAKVSHREAAPEGMGAHLLNPRLFTVTLEHGAKGGVTQGRVSIRQEKALKGAVGALLPFVSRKALHGELGHRDKTLLPALAPPDHDSPL